MPESARCGERMAGEKGCKERSRTRNSRYDTDMS